MLKSGLGLKPFIDELQALFQALFKPQIEHKFTLEDMNTKYGQ